MAELIQSISKAATEQATASENITKNMKQMGEVSSHNLASSRQASMAIKRLTGTSQKLAASVEAFKLAEDLQPQKPVAEKLQNADRMKPVEAVTNQQKLAVEKGKVKSLTQVKKVKAPVKAAGKIQQLA